jgi:hypothetical protein
MGTLGSTKIMQLQAAENYWLFRLEISLLRTAGGLDESSPNKFFKAANRFL